MNVTPITDLVGAVRGGRLILEEYFQGYNREKPYPLRSAAKSIGSVLVGIATDKGYLPGVEKPICPYFKDQTAGWAAGWPDKRPAFFLRAKTGFSCPIRYSAT